MRAFLLALVACGGNSAPSNDRPKIGTTKDNVCDQVAAVACYDLYACCTQGQIERLLNITEPESVSQCRDDVKRACQVKFEPQMFAVTQNRAVFDATVMDACLTALLAPDGGCATIGAAVPWIDACMTGAWTGAVVDAGHCNFSFECATSGRFCSPGQVCAPRPIAGEPCGTGCAAGNFCSGGICVAQLSPGAACSSSIDCQKDLYCDFGVAMPVCTPLKSPGETCDGFFACRNQDCLAGTCAGSTQPCFTSTQCTGRCSNNPGQACNVDCNCGIGHCSVATTTSCCSAVDCGPTGGTCVLPNQCDAVACLGDVVCASVELTIDYCTDVLADIPLPPP
jgi:hypothetical protein